MYGRGKEMSIPPNAKFDDLFTFRRFYGGINMWGKQDIDGLGSLTKDDDNYAQRKFIERIDTVLGTDRCAILLFKSSIGETGSVLLLLNKVRGTDSTYNYITSDPYTNKSLIRGSIDIDRNIMRRRRERYILYKCPYTFDEIITEHFGKPPIGNSPTAGDQGGELFQLDLAEALAAHGSIVSASTESALSGSSAAAIPTSSGSSAAAIPTSSGTKESEILEAEATGSSAAATPSSGTSRRGGRRRSTRRNRRNRRSTRRNRSRKN
jgi:hypothetical protein